MAQPHYHMPGPEPGEEAPDFCLPGLSGEVCLHGLRGRWVVLYFYPRDNTPGCTVEAREFTELLPRFEELGAVVIGVSKDSLESHRRFAERHGLRVELLSDPEHRVIEMYGAWGKKRMRGREYWGTVRTTYLIDPEGRVARVWRRVRARGHAARVLEELERLAGDK